MSVVTFGLLLLSTVNLNKGSSANTAKRRADHRLEKRAMTPNSNYCDCYGRNALHIASLCSPPTAVTADIVRLLINNNVSVSAKAQGYVFRSL